MKAAIHKHIQREEFDYQTLLDVLRDYGRPRDKISDLLRKGVIIRVKKGLYVLGDDYRSRPFSRELIANLIYGPSYVSLDSALQYHGLIPEHVEAVASVTTGRSRSFDTPVGRFTYRQIPLAAFQVGMSRVEETPGNAFLVAVAEKALADKIFDERNIGACSSGRMMDHLLDNLRLDQAGLMRLNPDLVREIAVGYRSRKLRILAEAIDNPTSWSKKTFHAISAGWQGVRTHLGTTDFLGGSCRVVLQRIILLVLPGRIGRPSAL